MSILSIFRGILVPRFACIRTFLFLSPRNFHFRRVWTPITVSRYISPLCSCISISISITLLHLSSNNETFFSLARREFRTPSLCSVSPVSAILRVDAGISIPGQRKGRKHINVDDVITVTFGAVSVLRESTITLGSFRGKCVTYVCYFENSREACVARTFARNSSRNSYTGFTKPLQFLKPSRVKPCVNATFHFAQLCNWKVSVSFIF